jgi:hypothetical protein
MKSQQKQLGIFHEPLKPKDTEKQTEGCRHTNPNICASNSLPRVCAFVRSDFMCLKPPQSWPKQFKVLLAQRAAKK